MPKPTISIGDLPTLKRGATGHDVMLLQQMLQSQGFFNAVTGGNFLDQTYAAVVHFQQTHQDRFGEWLEPDGVVGPETWWALAHPSGQPQRSNLAQADTDPQADRNDNRIRLLRWAETEHSKGIKEIPDGSNWSPRIAQYLAQGGVKVAAPWCAAFVCCASWEALGRCVFGHMAHCESIYNVCKKNGSLTKTPYPGHAFIMLHGDGTGHMGLVYRISGDGTRINTIEGNCGNRVKLGERALSSFAGFIDLVQEKVRPVFPVGLVSAVSTDHAADR